MVKMLPATSAPDHAEQPLDPARIGGISAALALHVIAFGLLLMPAQLPMQSAQPEQRTRYEPVFRTPPPPPPPPEVVPVVQKVPVLPKPATPQPPRPLTQPAVANTTPATGAPVADPPVVVPDGHANTLPPVTGGESGTGGGAPLSGVALQYRSNPRPAYPRDALRDGLQGTVMLRVLVDEQGRPVEVSVETSSGHRVLDRAAREQVLRRWSFVPAHRNGLAVRAIGLVPVDFRID